MLATQRSHLIGVDGSAEIFVEAGPKVGLSRAHGEHLRVAGGLTGDNYETRHTLGYSPERVFISEDDDQHTLKSCDALPWGDLN